MFVKYAGVEISGLHCLPGYGVVPLMLSLVIDIRTGLARLVGCR